MDRVNLLPEEAQMSFGERVVHVISQDFLKVMAGVCGTIVALGLIITLGQVIGLAQGKKQLKTLKEQIKILQVETQNMETFSKQLDQVDQELQRQKSVLENKLAYLKAVKERPRLLAVVLKEMRRNIPRGMWLTEMETGSGGALRIAGGATDENGVTQFMTNLKESPHFSNVGFTYTEKDSIGNVPFVKFEIVCRVG